MSNSSMAAGIGVRMPHHTDILQQLPPVGFLEAHSENYFGETFSRKTLLKLREHYQVSLHGVGLSLGRADDLDKHHLAELKKLVDEVDPLFVSEHLSWSAYAHRHVPDLLPLPLTEQALTVICQHIEHMQEVLGRKVLVENPSNYLLFDQLQIPEPEFLNLLAQRTGCGLLLDVNNIHVSAVNLQRDPVAYIDGIGSQYIKQYHLAGYTDYQQGDERVLIDTHDNTVYPEVWGLFEQTLQTHGSRPVLFEWDSDLPELGVLVAEAAKADAYIESAVSAKSGTASTAIPDTRLDSSSQQYSLSQSQDKFLDDILTLSDTASEAPSKFESRIWVYQNNVFGALHDYLQDVFPAARGVVGEDFFKAMTRQFVGKTPPQLGNIHDYGEELEAFVRGFKPLEELAYIGDLVAYEWAQHSAYYASDKPDMKIEGLDAEQQQALLAQPVELKDSVTAMQSSYPITEIHRQSLPDYSGEVNVELDQGGVCLVIYKSSNAVEVDSVMPEVYQLLAAITQYGSLLQALEGLAGSIEVEQQSQALAYVLQKQLIVSA